MTTKAYDMISDYYGEKCQERSGVPLINHIDEGLIILEEFYMADDYVKDAFCIHPMLQGDDSFCENHKFPGFSEVHHASIILAMEYRRVANSYLPKQTRKYGDHVSVGPSSLVNMMLVADKIQNCKDFSRNKGLYPNAPQLEIYFDNWLNALGISERLKAYLIEVIEEG